MSATRWGLILTAGLAALIAGWLLWFQPPPQPPPPVVEAPTVVAEPAPPPPPPPDFPVPEAPADAPATPTLADSDGSFSTALKGLPGASPIEAWLIPEMLIRRIVVTIDNLPRDRIAVKLRPLKPVAGTFVVDSGSGPGSGPSISPNNAPRYGAAVTLLQAIDSEALVALYFRWYPLFQQAYRELGYPEGRFNNRLVEVLDHLIATPNVAEPIGLVRPKVYYEFADPALEQASAGRKLLWRIGSDNRAAVIAKLKTIRARVAAGAVASP